MPTTPLVVGAPDFDNDARGDTQAAPSVARMLAPLPGARDEAMSIAQFLGVRALTDASASKPALLLTRSPRVLHVATHAYYLPPAELHAEAGSPTVVSDALPSRGLSRIAAVDDPMLRAGVALSGANNTLQHVETAVDIDSGLLSAREILSMDLRRTELVVLSACDTGLGAIVPGRTVAGLPRAFIVAGADSVVMSLWKVPDASTSALMKCFYRELSKGVSTADALRVAKLAAMKDCPHPRDWAAFICYGSDRLITATPDTAQPSEARDESEDDDGSNSPQPVSSNPLKLVPRP
jgi:CHAT domain-containing protein